MAIVTEENTSKRIKTKNWDIHYGDDAEHGVVDSGFQEMDRVIEAQPHHQVFPGAFIGIDHLVSYGLFVVKRKGQCRVPVWTEQSPFLQS